MKRIILLVGFLLVGVAIFAQKKGRELDPTDFRKVEDYEKDLFLKLFGPDMADKKWKEGLWEDNDTIGPYYKVQIQMKGVELPYYVRKIRVSRATPETNQGVGKKAALLVMGKKDQINKWFEPIDDPGGFILYSTQKGTWVVSTWGHGTFMKHLKALEELGWIQKRKKEREAGE